METAIDYFNKGNALQGIKKYEEAIAAYDKSITLIPNNFSVYFNKGLSLSLLKRFEEAISAFDKAISLNPNFIPGYLNKGMALLRLKRYEEGIVVYDQIIALDPNYDVAYIDKGDALRLLGKIEEAIVTYDKVITLNPYYTAAYNKKGSALCELKRFEEAIVAHDQAINLDSNDAYTYCYKGTTLHKLKRFEEAIDMFDKAITLCPKYYVAYNDKGLALSLLKKFEEAIIAYDLAISLNPNNEEAYSNKGLTLSFLNKFEEAIVACDKAILLDPNYDVAYNSKALVLCKLKNFEEAIVIYDKCLSLNKESPLYFVNRGRCYYSLKQHKKALDDFKAAQSLVSLGKWGGDGVSESQKSFIINTLKTVVELEKLFEKTEDLITASDQNNPIVQEALGSFQEVKEDRSQFINEKVNEINNDSASNVNMANEMAEMKRKLEELSTILMQQAQKINTQEKKIGKQTKKINKQARQIAKHEKQIDKHEVALQEGGVYDAAEISINIKTLKQEHEDLSTYYKTFCWTLNNYFQAYRVANTGIVQTDATFDATPTQSLLESSLKTAANYAIEAGKAMPVFGGLIEKLDGAIDSVCETIYKQKFDNKKDTINNIITAKLNSEQELGTNVSRAAIGIIEYKKQDILNPKTEETSNTNLGEESALMHLLSWVIDPKGKLKSELTKRSVLIDEEQSSPVADLALADVALVLSYLYKNSSRMVEEQSPFDEQLINVIKNNVSE